MSNYLAGDDDNGRSRSPVSKIPGKVSIVINLKERFIHGEIFHLSSTKVKRFRFLFLWFPWVHDGTMRMIIEGNHTKFQGIKDGFVGNCHIFTESHDCISNANPSSLNSILESADPFVKIYTVVNFNISPFIT
eukprot:4694391-Ditylum_brightwellii.AAC.1